MDEFDKINTISTFPNITITNQYNSNNQLISSLAKNNVVLNSSRRCSTGLLLDAPIPKINTPSVNKPNKLSSYRQLKKLSQLHYLHFEPKSSGLNGLNNQMNLNIYNQNLKLGLLLRSSLPATPISTPIHNDFQPFTEKLLLERLSRTPPLPRRQMNWNNNSRIFDSSLKRNSESNTSLNRHLEKHFLPYKNNLEFNFDLNNMTEKDIGNNQFSQRKLNEKDKNNNLDKK